MIRPRVEETSSTSGTGSFTLSGATSNNQTFNSAFGTSRPFKYYASSGSQWEQGIGYLSASTTLVRQKIEFNSLGTVAAVNFSSNPTVFCDATPSMGSNCLALRAAGEWIRSEDIPSELIEATRGLSSGYTFAMPFWSSAPNLVDAITINVTGTTGGGILRLGLYNHSTTTNSPGTLIEQSGEISAATPGWREYVFSSPHAIQGRQVWVAVLTNGVTVMSMPSASHSTAWLGCNRDAGHSAPTTVLIDDRGSGWLVSNGGSGMNTFSIDQEERTNTSPYIMLRTA